MIPIISLLFCNIFLDLNNSDLTTNVIEIYLILSVARLSVSFSGL